MPTAALLAKANRFGIISVCVIRTGPILELRRVTPPAYVHDLSHVARPISTFDLPVKVLAVLALLGLLLVGCATSSVSTRKQERAAAYAALPADMQQVVDEGNIKVGMTPDAVYIAWGPPSELLEQESAQGHITIWVYHGQWVEENRYWIGRHLETDYYPRSYVRAEIIFQNGAVSSWRTMPKPVP